MSWVKLLLRYINPHLARGALRSSSSLLMPIEVLMMTMKPYTNYTKLWLCRICHICRYTAGTLRSTSCSSLQRVLLGEDNALRGICVLIFTIHRHQHCGGCWHFVWNKFHTKHDDKSKIDNPLVWVEANLPYTANLWCRSSRWPARNTYTEHTLNCTFSISLDIIDWSRDI